MTALNAAAEAQGLRVGLAIVQAQALVPDLLVEDAHPQEDAAALERLAVWALKNVSPIVAADPPDGLVIDTTGADHLHGGEHAMLTSIVTRFATAGIEARAAIAGSWGAAHAAARYLSTGTLVIPANDDEAMLRPLPVAALRLTPDLVSQLRVLGLARIADLLDQPRAPLTLRFGPELGRRLDQALGSIAEPVDPIRPPDLVEAARVFAEPIGAPETIARYTAKLVTALCQALELRGLGARRLDLVCHRVDNRREAIRIGTARPSRDIKRLTRLLTDKIETIDPGFGIERMVLTAVLAEPLHETQTVSSLIEEPEADISHLIDVLANRVGEAAIYRFAPVESDVPERSVKRIAPLAPDTGATWENDWPRPPRLMERPEPVEAMALLPDHPPRWFRWRGIRRRVVRADGPERIRGEWWKRDAERETVRDYFRVEDDKGERFWIYRAGDGERPESGSQNWFLHGIFG